MQVVDKPLEATEAQKVEAEGHTHSLASSFARLACIAGIPNDSQEKDGQHETVTLECPKISNKQMKRSSSLRPFKRLACAPEVPVNDTDDDDREVSRLSRIVLDRRGRSELVGTGSSNNPSFWPLLMRSVTRLKVRAMYLLLVVTGKTMRQTSKVSWIPTLESTARKGSSPLTMMLAILAWKTTIVLFVGTCPTRLFFLLRKQHGIKCSSYHKASLISSKLEATYSPWTFRRTNEPYLITKSCSVALLKDLSINMLYCKQVVYSMS